MIGPLLMTTVSRQPVRISAKEDCCTSKKQPRPNIRFHCIDEYEHLRNCTNCEGHSIKPVTMPSSAKYQPHFSRNFIEGVDEHTYKSNVRNTNYLNNRSKFDSMPSQLNNAHLARPTGDKGQLSSKITSAMAVVVPPLVDAELQSADKKQSTYHISMRLRSHSLPRPARDANAPLPKQQPITRGDGFHQNRSNKNRPTAHQAVECDRELSSSEFKSLHPHYEQLLLQSKWRSRSLHSNLNNVGLRSHPFEFTDADNGAASHMKYPSIESRPTVGSLEHSFKSVTNTTSESVPPASIQQHHSNHSNEAHYPNGKENRNPPGRGRLKAEGSHITSIALHAKDHHRPSSDGLPSKYVVTSFQPSRSTYNRPLCIIPIGHTLSMDCSNLNKQQPVPEVAPDHPHTKSNLFDSGYYQPQEHLLYASDFESSETSVSVQVITPPRSTVPAQQENKTVDKQRQQQPRQAPLAKVNMRESETQTTKKKKAKKKQTQTEEEKQTQTDLQEANYELVQTDDNDYFDKLGNDDVDLGELQLGVQTASESSAAVKLNPLWPTNNRQMRKIHVKPKIERTDNAKITQNPSHKDLKPAIESHMNANTDYVKLSRNKNNKSGNADDELKESSKRAQHEAPDDGIYEELLHSSAIIAQSSPPPPPLPERRKSSVDVSFVGVDKFLMHEKATNKLTLAEQTSVRRMESERYTKPPSAAEIHLTRPNNSFEKMPDKKTAKVTEDNRQSYEESSARSVELLNTGSWSDMPIIVSKNKKYKTTTASPGHNDSTANKLAATITEYDVARMFASAPPGSIHQTYSVEHEEDEIIDLAKLNPLASDVTHVDKLLDVDTISEHVELDVAGGWVMMTVRVRSERILPIRGSGDKIFRKSAVIMTRVIAIDLRVSKERRLFYKSIVTLSSQETGTTTTSSSSGSSQLRRLNAQETFRLYRAFVGLVHVDNGAASSEHTRIDKRVEDVVRPELATG